MSLTYGTQVRVLAGHPRSGALATYTGRGVDGRVSIKEPNGNHYLINEGDVEPLDLAELRKVTKQPVGEVPKKKQTK